MPPGSSARRNKYTFSGIALAMACVFGAADLRAATFSYHGTLQDAGKPADGSYDLELTLYSAAQGGRVVGGPLAMYAVPVHGGSFSTQADFGPLTSNLSGAWLGVKVRNVGKGEYVALSTRSQVTSEATASVCPGAWTIDGNALTTPGTGIGQNYLGTADSQALVIGVDGLQAGRISPSVDATNYPDSANVVFGSSGNSAGTGTFGYGATVAGGGSAAAHACGAGNTQSCANAAVSEFDTVGGGSGNTASGGQSVVAGGSGNTASGFLSITSGGYVNQSTGAYSVVAGGIFNVAGGDNSFAAGYGANVRGASATPGCQQGACGDYGTFVWADAQASNFISSAPNQFLVRAGGGVGINTGAPISPLHVQSGGGAGAVIAPIPGTMVTLESSGNNFLSLITPAAAESAILFGNPSSPSDGSIVYNFNNVRNMQFNTGGNITWMTLTAKGQLGVGVVPGALDGNLIDTSANGAHLTGGGTWTNGSSRTFKEAFDTVDVAGVLAKVLALPVQTWFYKIDHAEGRHMGPMAEDFSQAFGLGADDKHIGTVDESGVAFAAIQGLNAKVDNANNSLRSENAVLREQNLQLQQQLDALSARLGTLENARGQ